MLNKEIKPKEPKHKLINEQKVLPKYYVLDVSIINLQMKNKEKKIDKNLNNQDIKNKLFNKNNMQENIDQKVDIKKIIKKHFITINNKFKIIKKKNNHKKSKN